MLPSVSMYTVEHQAKKNVDVLMTVYSTQTRLEETMHLLEEKTGQIFFSGIHSNLYKFPG